MTRTEAASALGIEADVSSEGLKKAYRRKAFETHPDRGGSAAEFLKIQVAYDVLMGAYEEGFSGSELDRVLFERLDDVRAAFAKLSEEADDYCERIFTEFDKRLVVIIEGYRSHGALRKNGQADIAALWATSISALAAFLENQVTVIADYHENWLQEYLRPAIDAAKRENRPRWFETRSSSIVAVCSGLTLSAAAVYFNDYWIALPVVPIVSAGLILPRKYLEKFNPKRIIESISLTDIRQQANLTRLDVSGEFISSENASFGGATIGIALGSALGPIGAVAGGAIGALVGWLAGESLEDRKMKLYQSVIEDLNRVVPTMLEAFGSRLGETETAMIEAIKMNFKRNVGAVVALMK